MKVEERLEVFPKEVVEGEVYIEFRTDTSRMFDCLICNRTISWSLIWRSRNGSSSTFPFRPFFKKGSALNQSPKLGWDSNKPFKRFEIVRFDGLVPNQKSVIGCDVLCENCHFFALSLALSRSIGHRQYKLVFLKKKKR